MATKETEEVYETADFDESPEDRTPLPQVRSGPNQDINETSIQPDRAFEIFMGKKYDLRGVDVSDNIGKKIELLKSITSAQPEATDGAARRESPMEKLRRLKAETAQLSQELTLLTQEVQPDEAAPVADARAWAWNEMKETVDVLQNQLVELSAEKKMQPWLDPDFQHNSSLAVQRQISTKLLQELEQFPKGGQPGEPEASATAGTSTAGVKYELYIMANQSKQAEAAASAELDRRIAALEQVLADEGGKHKEVTQAGIVPVIVQLEAQLASMNPATIDTVSRRLQHLNAELDTVNKKRQSQSAVDLIKDSMNAQKIDKIFSKMEEVEALAPSFDTLLDRLHALKTLHEEGAVFSKRLGQVETEQQDVKKLLESDMKLVQEVSTSMADNMAIIKSNIENMDKRMEALAAKMS